MDNQRQQYLNQVRLLINTLPAVTKETCFALKGGTAINLFVMDFPRLSVDIDLVYVPINDRDVALKAMHAALNRIVDRLNQPGIKAVKQTNKNDELRILVHSQDATIKIEVSPVWRGLILPPTKREVAENVEEDFGYATSYVVSLPDLYGSKLCAAMDRQHPRDLYDVKMLLETTGIDRKMYYGFLTYLLGHPRPLAELLDPNWKDLREVYKTEFQGMTIVKVSLEELNLLPQMMMKALKVHFTQKDYDFLMSYKQLQPKWELFFYPEAQCLPAIRWKQLNLKKMNVKKHQNALNKLDIALQKWLP